MKLNLRAVDLNLFPVFEAIMETGQYSKAAERLAMSQPAMSAAVQRLRDTLGDPLFVRTAKGVVATPKAEVIYQDIKEALALMRHGLSSQKGFDPKSQAHEFRVLSGDYFEFVVLPKLLEKVESQSQHIRLSLKPILDDSAKQLIHAQADIMLDAFLAEDERIRSEIVMEETLMVIASKHHPKIQNTLSIDDFYQAKHAVLPNRGRLLPLDKILQRPLKQERKIGVQVTQYISLLAAVGNSDFIATVPKYLANLYADAFQLNLFEFPLAVPKVPIYMMWSKAFDRDPANTWLLQQIRDSLKEIKQEIVTK
ncbi:MAG: LysR family transcriptional regulator [Gammaproteobacteria bacterium]|nr:LysR family transcriptional regulator [Gammaproteobacteria bacterium]